MNALPPQKQSQEMDNTTMCRTFRLVRDNIHLSDCCRPRCRPSILNEALLYSFRVTNWDLSDMSNTVSAFLRKGADPLIPIVACLLEVNDMKTWTFEKSCSPIIPIIEGCIDTLLRQTGSLDRVCDIEELMTTCDKFDKFDRYDFMDKTEVVKEKWFEYITRRQHVTILRGLLTQRGVVSCDVQALLRIAIADRLPFSLDVIIGVLGPHTRDAAATTAKIFNEEVRGVPMCVLRPTRSATIAQAVRRVHHMHSALLASLDKKHHDGDMLVGLLYSACRSRDAKTVQRLLRLSYKFTPSQLDSAMLHLLNEDDLLTIGCSYKKLIDALRQAGARWDRDAQLFSCQSVQYALHWCHCMKGVSMFGGLCAYLLKNVTEPEARQILVGIPGNISEYMHMARNSVHALRNVLNLAVMVYSHTTPEERLSFNTNTLIVVTTWEERCANIRQQIESGVRPGGTGFHRAMGRLHAATA